MLLIDFIKNNADWESLLSKEPYNIKVSRDDGYILFKYNQLSSDFLNPIVRECRGLILRESDLKVVCHPFDKFGNYGESYCPEIDWESASVQEKIDGSLIKLWFDDGIWQISTNGTIDAFKAELNSIKYSSFGDLVVSALPMPLYELKKYLDSNFTYMFELVSPYNRVVIPYEETKLYLLGVRDNISQIEYRPEDTILYKEHLFDIPKRYQLHSLADVKAAASELPWDEEGYVVCDRFYNRVKIKSPDYVKAHYARNNSLISWERLLEVVLAGEQAEFLIYASDFKEQLDLIENAYFETLSIIQDEVKNLHPEQFSSRKELAFYINDTKPSWLRSFLFKYDKIDEAIAGIRVAKWIEIFESRGIINE